MTPQQEYDQRAAAHEAALRPRLTDEFLAALVEAARVVGWGVDLIEVNDFIQSVYGIAGKPWPGAVEPYES